jgi:hypothetical protein
MSNTKIDAKRANQYGVTQQPEALKGDKYPCELVTTGAHRRDNSSSAGAGTNLSNCLAGFCCCLCLWMSCDSDSDGCHCDGCDDCDCGECDCNGCDC